MLDFAAPEWSGLLVHWRTSRTSEFFPQAGAIVGRHCPVTCWYPYGSRVIRGQWYASA
jgi:hypothetical protein